MLHAIVGDFFVHVQLQSSKILICNNFCRLAEVDIILHLESSKTIQDARGFLRRTAMDAVEFRRLRFRVFAVPR